MDLKKQKGQILLVVILVIIIASTVGLSIASRTITSLKSSTEEAESQKALAAAEAGIERVIQGNIPVEIGKEGSTNISIGVRGNLNNNSSYATQFEQVNNTTFLINGGNVIPKDEGADVWFVDHDVNGNPDYTTAVDFQGFLHLYWGLSSDSCNEAAIQAVIITGNPPVVPDTKPSNVKSYRYVYDPCSTRRSENKFTEADSVSFTINRITFNNRTKANNFPNGINPSEKIILIRVIPIYKDAIIGLDTCNPSSTSGCNNSTSLPSQGYKITSTGISGQANRKITVFKGYPQAYLPYLSYGLFVVN